jgi:hypothetical protein
LGRVSFCNITILGDICPVKQFRQSKVALWVSYTSTICSRPSPKWLPHTWAVQRGNGRKEVPYRWRGTAGSTGVFAQTQGFFFPEELMHFVDAGGPVPNKMMTSNSDSCVPLLFSKLN